MTGKLEIQWSPIENKFITWGAGICLYEVYSTLPEAVPNSHVFKISESHYAELKMTNSNFNYTRSIDVYPKCEADLLLAIGLTNGRVSLATFHPSPEHDVRGYVGKELVPRHARCCNDVLFNPVEGNLLAVGLDKYRADGSVLIWDINRLSSTLGSDCLPMRQSSIVSSGSLSVSVSGAAATATAAVEVAKPTHEFGTSETAYSLTWFRGSPKVMAAGMNGKQIKVYDLRDPNKMINSTFTKGVYGVCTNPNNDRYLASFYDTQICLWDIRNFEKPIYLIPPEKGVVQIAWCPTKQSALASLQRDSSVLDIFDIQHTSSSEEAEPTVLERVITPGSPHNITSFSWHPTDYNRLLTIALSGTIKDYKVVDRTSINWSAKSQIVWSHGPKFLRYIDDSFFEDLSNRFKKRAVQRYGLQENLQKNSDLVKDNMTLANAWNWLHLTEKLSLDGVLRDSEYKHPGIAYILSKIDSEDNKSEEVIIPWSDLGYPNCQGSAKYYRHDDRDKALQLCSWPVDRNSPVLLDFLNLLERSGAYTRAAAVAIFNLKLPLAIDILTRSPDNSEYGSSLNVVAMALSGFSDDPNSVWRQNSVACITRMKDPYLKAMFCFLTTENYDYSKVLNEKDVAVDDRVALACMYLPDSQLKEYMQSLLEELCKDGNLDGLLVTGNSANGLKLLQKYLNNTADIQSTALIAMRAFHENLESEMVKHWFENYRELLNHWRLYNERADFDIMLASYKTDHKPQPQVHVACNFCGKSISAYIHENMEIKSQSKSGITIKLTACPYCRKPLPRCAICLMHMGTAIPESEVTKFNDFDNWFTWCQTCRHGGHAGHLSKWFEEHQECPVSDCTCRCDSIDASVV
ncbi:unnamed protein product [Callosobruchus maculatus]|uniref:Uncharacterized protein n=1 Tax=Callosobruchus maculatus TaxID=64391 RepID=A0A653BT04_CALMS|nr:unnamed protein product [Callosobruchus maculatus]